MIKTYTITATRDTEIRDICSNRYKKVKKGHTLCDVKFGEFCCLSFTVLSPGNQEIITAHWKITKSG